MKIIDISYLQQIEEAFREATASSCNWAEARVREIQDYLESGEKIQITEGTNETIISSITALAEWKNNKNLAHISFGIQVDNAGLIQKLNTNVERFEVSKIEVSAGINNFSQKENLKMNLCSTANQCFYGGFKDTIFHDFTNPAINNIKSVSFRIADSNELERMKQEINIKKEILIIVDIRRKFKRRSIHRIVCREVEC